MLVEFVGKRSKTRLLCKIISLLNIFKTNSSVTFVKLNSITSKMSRDILIQSTRRSGTSVTGVMTVSILSSIWPSM